MISRARAGFPFPDRSSRPNQQLIAAHQPTLNPATPFLSLTDRARVSVNNSSSSLFPSPRIHTAPAPDGRYPFCPRATHLYILACAKGSGAASAARSVKARAAWGFRLDDRGARVQRQGRGLRPGRPSYQPPLGFSLSSTPERAP
jgi:hypothetical protein